MAETTYPVHIAGPMPAADWVSQNPTLEQFVLGQESDEGGVKIGPGAWNSLPYLIAPKKVRALTDAATVVWAFAGNEDRNASVTLTASRTLSITGATNGASGTIKVIQGGSGSYALTLPAGSKVINGGSGAVTLTTTVGAIDILSFVYDGTNYFFTVGLNFT